MRTPVKNTEIDPWTVKYCQFLGITPFKINFCVGIINLESKPPFRCNRFCVSQTNVCQFHYQQVMNSDPSSYLTFLYETPIGILQETSNPFDHQQNNHQQNNHQQKPQKQKVPKKQRQKKMTKTSATPSTEQQKQQEQLLPVIGSDDELIKMKKDKLETLCNVYRIKFTKKNVKIDLINLLIEKRSSL